MKTSRFVPVLAMVALLGACDEGGGSGFGVEPAPTYGACGLEPNYVGAVRLNRWRSFPLSYFFDESSFPADLRADYRSGITEGIRRWHAATPNELGSVVETSLEEEADFVIDYGAVTPVDRLARVIHSNGIPFLSGGRMIFNATALPELEERIRSGTASREDFRALLAALSAHEMGHLLGIIFHPNRDDSIMSSFARNPHPTPVDVNTLTHAYCE